MLWIKALHVISMVTWFAGLFYLPRLFVYHAQASDPVGIERFKVMERRLLKLMTLGMLLTALFGAWTLALEPVLLGLRWMQVKLALVACLFGYHGWCWRLVAAFAADRNRHGSTWYRYFNEAPSLLLVAIVILVIVRPFP